MPPQTVETWENYFLLFSEGRIRRLDCKIWSDCVFGRPTAAGKFEELAPFRQILLSVLWMLNVLFFGCTGIRKVTWKGRAVFMFNGAATGKVRFCPAEFKP